MSSNANILAFAGSLRAESLNKILLRTAVRAAESEGASVTTIDLADYPMPVYDGDLEAKIGLPESAEKLKALFTSHNGLLIAAPEYNSSITAALKNLIDWVSRKNGAPDMSGYQGKTAGLIAAGGGMGGLRGLVHVRQILGNIGVLVIPEQAVVPNARDAFDDEGNLKDEGRRTVVENVGAALARTLGKLHG
ncbi:MAG: NAD(P)H-dependent oxidoreductase [Alphaproteobacteria bacterium]|nr:NAD(P)H-dependent oxidoreductase [Alphaproteobacteria bacterium]